MFFYRIDDVASSPKQSPVSAFSKYYLFLSTYIEVNCYRDCTSVTILITITGTWTYNLGIRRCTIAAVFYNPTSRHVVFATANAFFQQIFSVSCLVMILAWLFVSAQMYIPPTHTRLYSSLQVRSSNNLWMSSCLLCLWISSQYLSQYLWQHEFISNKEDIMWTWKFVFPEEVLTYP